MFLKALRKVAESRQMTKVAEDAGVTREHLYRITRESGNPTYSSLGGILRALGLTLVVQPVEEIREPTSPSAPSLETTDTPTTTPHSAESTPLLSTFSLRSAMNNIGYFQPSISGGNFSWTGGGGAVARNQFGITPEMAAGNTTFNPQAPLTEVRPRA